MDISVDNLNKRADCIKDWSRAIGYVLFIYLTLNVMPLPLATLRAHGVLRLCLAILFSICFLISLLFLIRTKTLTFSKLAMLILIFSFYGFMGPRIGTPEERVHFFEYGLVGILFVQALRHHIKSARLIFLASLISGSIVGWLDEIIQGFLPRRHYDPKDIALNVVSIFLGLLLFSIFPNSFKPTNSD